MESHKIHVPNHQPVADDMIWVGPKIGNALNAPK